MIFIHHFFRTWHVAHLSNMNDLQKSRTGELVVNCHDKHGHVETSRPFGAGNGHRLVSTFIGCSASLTKVLEWYSLIFPPYFTQKTTKESRGGTYKQGKVVLWRSSWCQSNRLKLLSDLRTSQLSRGDNVTKPKTSVELRYRHHLVILSGLLTILFTSPTSVI